MIPSIEQVDIIESVLSGNNVICDAVAGSGKTTTLFMMAQKMSSLNFLQVTYNARLKNEVREKCIPNCCLNIDVHSYHSLALKLYISCNDDKRPDDNSIMEIIEFNHPLKKKPNIDIIVVDETQDMTPLYCKFLKKVISDLNNHKLLLVFLGDVNQSIFKYKHADGRFLSLADEIYRMTKVARRPLHESYRVTHQIAQFINNVMLDGVQRIKSQKQGEPVKYIYGDIFTNVLYYMVKEIKSLIRSGKYTAGDFFVIIPSTKRNGLKSNNKDTPLQIFAKMLKNDNEITIDCYIPSGDESKLSDEVMKEKIVFSTYHQIKGLERKVVILFGFDNSYFNYYARDEPTDKCCSTLYVGATRASELLFLLVDAKNGHLPFIKTDLFDKSESAKYMTYMTYMTYIKLPFYSSPSDSILPKKPNMKIAVTSLVQHLTNKTIFECEKLMNTICISLVSPKYDAPEIPYIMKCKNSKKEEVSDLNGIIIPVMWEAKFRCVDEFYRKANKYKSDINTPCETIEDFTKVIIYYDAMYGYPFRAEQINCYDWLTQDMIDYCHSVLDNNIIRDKIISTESDISAKHSDITIDGRIDIVTDTDIWELKCVNTINIEHKLQLVIYAWMWMRNFIESGSDYDNKQFKLLNCRTGEVLQILPNYRVFDEIVTYLLKNRYNNKITLCDNAFILKNQ